MSKYRKPPDIQPVYSNEFKARMLAISKKREQSKSLTNKDVIEKRGQGYTFSVGKADEAISRRHQERDISFWGDRLPISHNSDGNSVNSSRARNLRTHRLNLHQIDEMYRALPSSSLSNRTPTNRLAYCAPNSRESLLSSRGNTSVNASSSNQRFNVENTRMKAANITPILGNAIGDMVEYSLFDGIITPLNTIALIIITEINYGYQRSPDSKSRSLGACNEYTYGTGGCPVSPSVLSPMEREDLDSSPGRELWHDAEGREMHQQEGLATLSHQIKSDRVRVAEGADMRIVAPSGVSGTRDREELTHRDVLSSVLLALPAHWMPRGTVGSVIEGGDAEHGIVVVRSTCTLQHLVHALRQQLDPYLPEDFDIVILRSSTGDVEGSGSEGWIRPERSSAIIMNRDKPFGVSGTGESVIVQQTFVHACSSYNVGTSMSLSLDHRCIICVTPSQSLNSTKRLPESGGVGSTSNTHQTRVVFSDLNVHPSQVDQQIDLLEYELRSLDAVVESKTPIRRRSLSSSRSSVDTEKSLSRLARSHERAVSSTRKNSRSVSPYQGQRAAITDEASSGMGEGLNQPLFAPENWGAISTAPVNMASMTTNKASKSNGGVGVFNQLPRLGRRRQVVGTQHHQQHSFAAIAETHQVVNGSGSSFSTIIRSRNDFNTIENDHRSSSEHNEDLGDKRTHKFTLEIDSTTELDQGNPCFRDGRVSSFGASEGFVALAESPLRRAPLQSNEKILSLLAHRRSIGSGRSKNVREKSEGGQNPEMKLLHQEAIDHICTIAANDMHEEKGLVWGSYSPVLRDPEEEEAGGSERYPLTVSSLSLDHLVDCDNNCDYNEEGGDDNDHDDKYDGEMV